MAQHETRDERLAQVDLGILDGYYVVANIGAVKERLHSSRPLSLTVMQRN
jgi:hypothetical protein